MAVHTVYVVVFVSFGWFFFFGFCLLALWYFLSCRHKKKEKKLQETEVIRRDEHLKVKEDLVKGPKGAEAVALSIEKDETFEEDIIKDEKAKEMRGKNMHWKNGGDIEQGASSASNLR